MVTDDQAPLAEYFDEDADEDGLCLDNDSPFNLFLKSEEGIPINGFGGESVLTPIDQARMRVHVSGRCSHQHTEIVITLDKANGQGGGTMQYSCTDCGKMIIGGPVTSMRMEHKAPPQIPIHTVGNPAVAYTDSGPMEFRVDVTALNI